MKQVIPFSKEIEFKTNIASITSISLEHEEKIKEGEIVGDFIVFGDYKIHNDTTEKELFKYRLPFTALIPDNIEQSTISIDVQDFTYDQTNENTLKVDIDFYLEGEEKETLENDDAELERNEILDEQLKNEDEVPEIETLEEEPFNDSEFLKVDVDFEREMNDLIEQTNTELENKVEGEALVQDEIRGNEIMNEMNIMDELNTEIKMEEIDNKVEIETTTEVEQESKDGKVTETKEEYVTYHVHIVKESETLENILNIYSTSIDVIKDYNDLTNLEIGQKLIIPEYVDE